MNKMTWHYTLVHKIMCQKKILSLSYANLNGFQMKDCIYNIVKTNRPVFFEAFLSPVPAGSNTKLPVVNTLVKKVRIVAWLFLFMYFYQSIIRQ